MVLLGNAVAIWVAHAFADAAAHETSTMDGLRHATPVLAVAAPSAVVLLVAWALGWSGETGVVVAEAVNLIAMVTLQLLNARRQRFRVAQLAQTLALDALAAAVVVSIIALLK